MADAGETALTPGETLKKDALKSVTVSDSRGRAITVKKLTPLDRMQMAKVMGQNSGNEAYAEFALLAYSVTAIGPNAFGAPANELQLEQVIGELGDEGMEIMPEAFKQLYPKLEQSGAADTIKK